MTDPRPTRTDNSIARAVALGQQREAIEQRYERARAEYIEASKELKRYRELYARVVGAIPDSIDLQTYPDMQQEPKAPRLVTAGEMERGEGE